MEICNYADANISKSCGILPKDEYKHERDEMQDALMKVMTKIFSAKVILERLPEINVRENETVDEKDSELDKSDDDQSSNQKDKDLKGMMLDMCTKSCPKCHDKFKGELSHNQCKNCKNRFVFKCKKCNKELSSYVGMQRHLLQVCNFQGYYYQCPECLYKSVVRNKVESHREKLHPNRGKDSIKTISSEDCRNILPKYLYKCEKCGNRFRHKHNLMHHSRALCGKLQECVFDNADEINSTEAEETETPDRFLIKSMTALYCLACDKEQVFKDDTIPRSEKCPDCNASMSFKCSKCNHTCKCYAGMISHLRSKCVPQKSFKCSKCEYKNPVRRSTLIHYKNVHEATAVECPQCGIQLKNKRTLYKHSLYCNKKPYLFCAIRKCSFKTSNPTSLKIHNDRHLQTDKSECPKCKKKFKNLVTMKNHMFTCGSECRFFCDNCSHSTKFKRDLQIHMLRRHLREINNDYAVCPKCGVVFKNTKQSRGHLRLCKTSKPRLQCKYCYYMVEEEKKQSFQHHMKAAHPKVMESNHSKNTRRNKRGQNAE